MTENTRTYVVGAAAGLMVLSWPLFVFALTVPAGVLLTVATVLALVGTFA